MKTEAPHISPQGGGVHGGTQQEPRAAPAEEEEAAAQQKGKTPFEGLRVTVFEVLENAQHGIPAPDWV